MLKNSIKDYNFYKFILFLVLTLIDLNRPSLFYYNYNLLIAPKS